MANNNVELTPEELQAFMDAGPAQGTATPTEQIPSTPVAGQELSEAELKAFMDAGPAQPQQEQVVYNPIPEGWTKEQYDAAQKNLRTPDTEGKSYWELLKEAVPDAAEDLGNIAKFNAARAAASVNAGIANVAEAFGGDSEFTRANQAYFQDAAKNAKGALADTYGEGIGRDLMLETMNPLNILPFGAGRAGLATLGGVVGADTAMNIATEGDRSGITMDDVGKVTTAGLMGVAGGKVIDTAGKALAKKISGDMSEVPFEDLLTKGSEELKNIRSGKVKPTAKNTRAMIELAKRSEGNPEIAKAIEELDVSIPMDYVATGKVGAELADQANAGRSIIGSDASQQMKNTIDEIKVKFDDWMQKNGQRDVSAISGEVKDELNKQIDEITTKTSDLYQSIESKIPDGEILESPKTLELLNKYIKSAGGKIKYLPGPLQELYEVLSRGTLDTLKEERSLIGAATSKLNSNKYKNVSSKKVKDLYDAMKKDQRYNLEKYAPELKDSLADADKMYVELKSLEDKLKVGFGKEGTGSLVNKLSNALNSGKKGDITNLTKYIDVIIPENKRAEALLSSIHELSQKSGEFNFSNFNKIWGNLSKHKETRELLVKSMGEDMVNKLDQWDKITFAMEKSLKSIRGNRNLNKHIINEKMDKDVIGGMLRKVIEGTSASFGMPISLNKIMKSPLWKLEELNKLVDSPEFKKIMLDTINGRNIEKVSPFKKKLTQLLGNIFVKEGAQKAADKTSKDYVPNEGFKKVNWFSDRVDKPEGLNSLTANPKGKNLVKQDEPIEAEIVEPEAQKLIGNNKGDQKLIGNNKKGQALIEDKKSGQATIENKRSGQKLLENIAKPEGPKDGLDTLVEPKPKPKPKKAPKKKVEPKKEPEVKVVNKLDEIKKLSHLQRFKMHEKISKEEITKILQQPKIDEEDLIFIEKYYDNVSIENMAKERLIAKKFNRWDKKEKQYKDGKTRVIFDPKNKTIDKQVEELNEEVERIRMNFKKREFGRSKEGEEKFNNVIKEIDDLKRNVILSSGNKEDLLKLIDKLYIDNFKKKTLSKLSEEKIRETISNLEYKNIKDELLSKREINNWYKYDIKQDKKDIIPKVATKAKTDTSVLNFTPKDKGLDSLTKQTESKKKVELKDKKNNTGYNEDMKKETKTNTSALDSLNKKSDPNKTNMIVPDKDAEVEALSKAIQDLPIDGFKKKIAEKSNNKKDLETMIDNYIEEKGDTLKNLATIAENKNVPSLILDKVYAKNQWVSTYIAKNPNSSADLLHKVVEDGTLNSSQKMSWLIDLINHENVSDKTLKKVISLLKDKKRMVSAVDEAKKVLDKRKKQPKSITEALDNLKAKEKPKKDPKLAVLHNLREDALKFNDKVFHTNRQGDYNQKGMPGVSVAITKQDQDFGSFGDITLVGNKEMLTEYGKPGKIDSRNKVFDRDIYSSRTPSAKWGNQLYIEGLSKDMEDVIDMYYNGSTSLEDLISFDKKHGKTILVKAFKEQNQGKKATKKALKEWLEENRSRAPYFEHEGKRIDMTNESVLEHIYGITPYSRGKRKVAGTEGSFWNSKGENLAAISKQYKSISAINKNKNLIVSQEEMKKFVEKTDKNINDLHTKIYGDNYTFGGFEEFQSGLYKGTSPKAEWSDKLKSEYRDLQYEVQNSPTEYFEAKLLRKVELGEWQGALVPENVSKETLAILRKHKIKVKKYKEGSRAETLNNFLEENDKWLLMAPVELYFLPDMIEAMKQEESAA